MAKRKTSDASIKLKTLCERLSVDYDEARYTLARGVRPKGIKAIPGRGNHRLFDRGQAFQLAVVLKLKAVGITTPLASQIATWSRAIQGTACNLGWDHRFAPFAGQLTTEHRWFVEVGDARYARVVTDANPSHPGLFEMPWADMKTRKAAPTACPVVILRVDIAQIAQELVGSEPANDT